MSHPQAGQKPAAVKRRLRQIEKTINALRADLKILEGQIPVPDSGEFLLMESGETPFTPDVLLLGVVRRIGSSLGHMAWTLDNLLGYTPAELRRHQTGFLRVVGDDVLLEIRAAIHPALSRTLDSGDPRGEGEPCD